MAKRWKRALLIGMLCSAPVAAGETRRQFQALLDLDSNTQSGCEVHSSAGGILGNEARISAYTRDQALDSVTVEVCVAGAWQQSTQNRGSGQVSSNEADTGRDVVEWQIDAANLRADSPVTLTWLTHNPSSGAMDLLAVSTPVDWPRAGANAGTAAQPIPALTGWSWAILGLGICAVAGLRRARYSLVSIGLFVVLSGMLPSAPQAQISNAALHSDPGNDQVGVDPGVDILLAQFSSVPDQLLFRITVNDIDQSGLPDAAFVLFIGNSLTASNNLPQMVQAIARQAGKTLTVTEVSAPGYSLEDMYAGSEALQQIRSGLYQVVVMQQGPSALVSSQVHLQVWANQFAEVIRANGSVPALLMVWPEFARIGLFGAVRRSYFNAAQSINGLFIPAGETWRAAWKKDPSLPLYDTDAFHPSPTGSYAAALSIFVELYGQTPEGLPANLVLRNGELLSFPTGTARLLQASAWEAHVLHGRQLQ